MRSPPASRSGQSAHRRNRRKAWAHAEALPPAPVHRACCSLPEAGTAARKPTTGQNDLDVSTAAPPLCGKLVRPKAENMLLSVYHGPGAIPTPENEKRGCCTTFGAAAFWGPDFYSSVLSNKPFSFAAFQVRQVRSLLTGKAGWNLLLSASSFIRSCSTAQRAAFCASVSPSSMSL